MVDLVSVFDGRLGYLLHVWNVLNSSLFARRQFAIVKVTR